MVKRLELFSATEMARADGLAASRDVASRDLMEMAERMRHAVSVEKRLKALERC